MVVGAGPLGIELAVALKRAGIRYIHVEAGQLGQTMLAWPPMTRWFRSPSRFPLARSPIQAVLQYKFMPDSSLTSPHSTLPPPHIHTRA